jgi:hypothetical protein
LAASSWRPWRVSQRGDGTRKRNEAAEKRTERHARMRYGVRHEKEDSRPEVP